MSSTPDYTRLHRRISELADRVDHVDLVRIARFLEIPDIPDNITTRQLAAAIARREGELLANERRKP